GDAGHAVAAVGRRRTRLARLAAHRAEAIASRNAERIELADAGIAGRPAAVVARRRYRFVAGIGGLVEVADIAFRIAAHRVAAEAHEVARVGLLAGDVSRAGKPGAGGAAAIAVVLTKVPVGAAALRGLADLEAGRAIGLAQAAAAIAATVAQRSV